jgi:hypothetical protein
MFVAELEPPKGKFQEVLTVIQTALGISYKVAPQSEDLSNHDCITQLQQKGLHIQTKTQLDDAHDGTLTPEAEEQLRE